MDAIRLYVQGAFAGIPETPESLEQQEEIVADLTARVADLVDRGQTEEEARGIALASIGDLDPLVSEFEPDEVAPVTVDAFVTRVGLHTAAASTSLVSLALLLFSVGAFAMGGFYLGHALIVLVFLVGFAAWVTTELAVFHRDPRREAELGALRARHRGALAPRRPSRTAHGPLSVQRRLAYRGLLGREARSALGDRRGGRRGHVRGGGTRPEVPRPAALPRFREVPARAAAAGRDCRVVVVC